MEDSRITNGTTRGRRRVCRVKLFFFTLVGVAAGVAATPTAASGSAVEGALSGSRPNIIFILADDLGYGDLGCYGQRQIQTPRLDRLATEGIRFTQAYAGSTVCAPSRCALMTGLHTGHCRIRGNASVPLKPEDVTVAEVLRDAGYTTGAFGKWGLGDEGTSGAPNPKGFQHWFGYLSQVHAHNYYPEFLWKNEERFPLEGNIAQGGVASQRARYSHDVIMDAALAFLDEHSRERFFLYLAPTLPHANNEAGRALGNGMEIPDLGEYVDRDWPEPEKGRAAMISRLDRDVGRVLDKLDELGVADRTIVFFSSDNGPHSEGGSSAEFFGSSGRVRGKKRDLTDGGIRVPGLVRWKGRLPKGLSSDVPWAFWDFLPTAADLAGARAPVGDGLSIVGLLNGGSSAQRRGLYWEFHEGGFHQAARIGDWKGIRHNGTAVTLYNLTEDLAEERDVATQHPRIARELEEFMDAQHVDSADFPVRLTPAAARNAAGGPRGK